MGTVRGRIYSAERKNNKRVFQLKIFIRTGILQSIHQTPGSAGDGGSWREPSKAVLTE